MQNNGSNGQQTRLSWHLLWRSRTFRAVVYLFGAANAATLVKLADPNCCAVSATVGFPFPFYAPQPATLYVTGFLLDLAVVLTLAVCGAWLGHALQRDDP